MNTYCYHTRDFLTGEKLTGGMLHAENYEDAILKATAGLKVELSGTKGGITERQIFLNESGKRVYLYVSVHPEYLLDKIPPRNIIDRRNIHTDGYDIFDDEE